MSRTDAHAFRPVHSLAEGKFSSRALVERYLSRVEKYGERLHAFVAVYAEDVLRAAHAADEAIAAGPWHRRMPAL